MRQYLENTKTIIGETLGLVGGFCWGYSSQWDWEPLLLTLTSGFFLFISFVLKLLPKDEPRPIIDLELKRNGAMRSSPKISVEHSPKDDLGYFLIKPDGKYYYTIKCNYELTIRNNSDTVAHYLQLFMEDKGFTLVFHNRHNELDPIILDKPVVLKAVYALDSLMTQIEADQIINNDFPEKISGLRFIASYQNQFRNKVYYTHFLPPNQNLHSDSKIDTSRMIRI